MYAIVVRDRRMIHFRCAEPPTANPDKYEDELLDAYVLVEDADALYAEFAAGDVRAGSVKRVAAGVGEGALAITFVHQVLSA